MNPPPSMKIINAIRRLFWRAVLCEPEERAEILSYNHATSPQETHEESLARHRRLVRYEFTFGKFEP